MSFQRAADYTDATRKSGFSVASGSQVTPYPPGDPRNDPRYDPRYDPRNEGHRRSSYYNPSPNSYGPPQRTRPGGYYGRNSSYGFRADSYVENNQGPNHGQSNRGMRTVITPPYGQNGDQVSPTHSHQVSYETMTSGSDENAKTTNPSSVNSSFDHIQPYKKSDEMKSDGPHVTSYGSNATNSTVRPYGYPAPFAQNGSSSRGPATLSDTLKDPRAPIKLNNGTANAAEIEAEMAKMSPQKEKRKSWLRRTFSRRNS